MSLFTGSQQQALQAAVEDAFDADDLARLAKFRLGQSLQVMVQTDRALSAVVFDLIQFVESRGWTDEFVRGVYEERKDNLVVRQFCEANAQFVFVPRASTTELAREVGSGLDAVTGRMANKTDPVRAILAGQASLTLSDLGTQFTRLRKYKVLHDCLHNLQFKYARLIKTEIRVFKDDLNAADNLGTYFQEMSDELTQAL